MADFEDDDLKAVKRGPGGLIFLLLLVGAVGGGGYWVMQNKDSLLNPVESTKDVEQKALEALAKNDDDEAIMTMTAAALFDIKKLEIPVAGEAPDAKRTFVWERWSEADYKRALNVAEGLEGPAVFTGVELGFQQCVAAFGAKHERACSAKLASFMRKNLRRLITDLMEYEKFPGDDVAKVLGAITKGEKTLTKAVAVGLVPFLRRLDIKANGAPQNYVVGDTDPLPNSDSSVLDLLLTLQLAPPEGTSVSTQSCKFSSSGFDYPAQCMGDRDLEKDLSAEAGRGRYSFWELNRRLFSNARMMKALSKTAEAKAYLEKLGQKETVARNYGGDVKPLSAVKPQAVDDYLFKLQEMVKGLEESGVCGEIVISKPQGALPKDQTFTTSAGQKLSGDKAVRVAAVNKVPLDVDVEEVPGLVGKVAAVFLNHDNPKESFARRLELNDVAAFDLPAGKYTMVFELADVVLPSVSVSGFCHIAKGTLRPGYYHEVVTLEGSGADKKAEGASAGSQKK